ncbi:MAG: carboxypeptidase-like regulatory domain-containing protein [Bacteroidota bacterium]
MGRIYLVLLFLFPCYDAFTQTAAVTGTVRDAATGEELIGVNVLIVGTTQGATTDLDGKYLLKSIPQGPFDLRFSYVGYASKLITQVKAKTGEPLKLDVNLTSNEVTTDEVVVTAERQLSTESAMLAQRRKASTIGDAVSIEQVKRSPDATSGDALKRVTGVTIFDNKFVVVRGVTDRYNGATLNGVSVTSTDTDVDKKSFSFDMIPANLLENMTVTKTATPDLPGDFTGGLVQINTLDFPDQRTLKLSLSSSSNSITTLGTVQKSQGAAKDWAGFDNGYRGFPGNDIDISYDLPKKLPNNWKQRSERAPLNGGINLSYGDRFETGDESKAGFIAGVSYRNGYQRTRASGYYEIFAGSPIFDGAGTRDAYTVLMGGLLNMSYQFSPFHKISINNNFNQSGEDKVTRIEYQDENEELNIAELIEWDQRSSYVAQLSGTHNLVDLNGLEVQWRGSYSSSISKEPDRKESVYAKPLRAPASLRYSFESARRSWSNLNEYSRGIGVDFTLSVFSSSKLKFGGLVEGKSRNFDIRFFQVDSRNVQDGNILFLPLDSIFVPDNFDVDKFFFLENSSLRDIYSGTHDLYATYVSFDQRFSLFDQDFRVVGGARVENSEQLVNTLSPFATNEPFVARVKNIDVLPSMNFTYLINEIANFRLAYSQSVNRPEFRELSAFYFYDFNIFEGTYGNPLLVRALSRNYDVRFEIFPDLGEVFALSYFHKSITNAIEQRIVRSSNPERTWFNSPRGKNRGWEIEMRKSLSFIGEYFSNFTIMANYTRVYSDIDYQVVFNVFDPNDPGQVIGIDSVYLQREMQGQSPYTVNVSLGFTEPSLGTTISILYNEFGKRVDAIGDERELDIIEEPRGVMDLSITQPVVSGLEMKFTVKDLNAKAREFKTREGKPYRSIFAGRTYSLQASFSF